MSALHNKISKRVFKASEREPSLGWLPYKIRYDMFRNLTLLQDPLADREPGWVARASKHRGPGLSRSFLAFISGAGELSLAASRRFADR